MHSLARVPPLGDRENHSRIVIKTNPITLHFTIILGLTSGRKHQREKIKWQ